jgi:hypothetical protein
MKKATILTAAAICLWSHQAEVRADELEYRLGGRLQSDLRFRYEDKTVGDYYKTLEWKPGLARNENVFNLKAEAWYGHFAAVVDVDFVWLGYPENPIEVGALSDRSSVDPYYLQAHALYIEATNLFVDGFDLKVGQQLVLWGVGDQFNPTNNLNSNDVEDKLMFGELVANFMVRADYTFLDEWTLSGVLVPIFKPALLPRSGPLATALVDRIPFNEERLRYRVQFENAMSVQGKYPAVVSDVTAVMPERNFENMPFSFRLAGNLFGQDVAVSYYRGRHDFPQAVKNDAFQNIFDQPLCNPDIPSPDPDLDCIDGVIETDVLLEYPKMQVIGFNMAGEIPLDWISESLLGLGYRIELGVYLPQTMEYELQKGDVLLGGFLQQGGEYDYQLPDGRRPHTVDDTVFAKWVIGLDYTFGSQFMLTAMWVHGLSDEFGAGDFFHEGMVVREGGVATDDPILCLLEEIMVEGNDQIVGAQNCGNRYTTEVLRPRLGDYLALVMDFKFLDDKALLRLFIQWDLSGYYRSYFDEAAGHRVKKYLSLFGDGFSMIVFPEFNYNFGNGLELGLGALIQLGKNYTKFGDPGAGGSMVWTRARFSF